jgi:glutathione reductase (NADPH)
VAIREGAAFAETEFYGKPTSFDHDTVASGGVLAAADRRGRPERGRRPPQVRQGRHLSGRFRPMKYAFTGGEERCLMKLVVDAASDRVVGVHVVGPDAPEIIQMAAIAVKMGVTKAQWDSTCAVHPTLAEELVTMREKYVPPDPRPGRMTLLRRSPGRC